MDYNVKIKRVYLYMLMWGDTTAGNNFDCNRVYIWVLEWRLLYREAIL